MIEHPYKLVLLDCSKIGKLKYHTRRTDFNIDNNNDYDDYAHSVSKTRNLRIIFAEKRLYAEMTGTSAEAMGLS